jgi:SAM-dependent methyltransferase
VTPDDEATRSTSFGEQTRMTPVDRLGVWLSERGIRRAAGSFAGRDIGDFGCGYDATFVRRVLPEVRSATLVDLSLADDLSAHPKVTAVTGRLPEVMADLPAESLDLALSISVLEHLHDPLGTLREMHRLLRPGGVCLVNVPSWLGKAALETSAFRLGLSPACEMDDHKRYYDPRDLWPLLVAAGFPPHAIRCRRHKGGLNTFASCRKEAFITDPEST